MKSMKPLSLAIALALSSMAGGVYANTADHEALAPVLEGTRQRAHGRTTAPDSEEIQSILAVFDEQGRYEHAPEAREPRIYVVGAAPSDVREFYVFHVDWLENLEKLSALYVNGEGHSDPAIKETIYKSLEYWFAHSSPEPYWLHTFRFRTTGLILPALQSVMINLWDELEADLDNPETRERTKGLITKVLDYTSALSDHDTYASQLRGTNSSGVTKQIIDRAMIASLISGREEMDRAYNKIFAPSWDSRAVSELRGESEHLQMGVQADGSFFHHGFQVSNSYGFNWLRRVTSIAQRLQGTDWAMKPEHVIQLENYLLDALSWKVVNEGYMDLGIVGGKRVNAYRHGHNFRFNDDNLLTVTEELLKLDNLNRRDEILALRDKVKAGDEPQGNRVYWVGDYMLHRGDGWYMSFKPISPSSRTYEWGESLLLTSGFTGVYQEGDEHQRVRAVWDWRNLPGVTQEQIGANMLNLTGYNRQGESTSRAGYSNGVSNGEYGFWAFEYDLNHPSVATMTANKSVFFAGDYLAALGSNIQHRYNYSHGLSSVFTTIEQAEMKSAITYSVDGGEVTTINSPKERSLTFRDVEGVSWFHHNGNGYVILPQEDKPYSAHLWAEEREADISWAKDNDRELSYDSLPVFQLSVDHGIARNMHNNQYSYLTFPNVSVSELQDIVADLSISVVVNTPEIQAIHDRDNNVTQVAFYQPGEVKVSDTLSLKSESPLLVMVHEQDGQVEISVSDPMASAETTEAVVYISERLTGKGAEKNGSGTRLTFSLPDELYQEGRTVTKSFQRS